MSLVLRIAIILLKAFVGMLAVFMWPPLPQDPAYHNFADQTTIFGIPNFFDVASNLPFLFVGVAGMAVLRRRWHDPDFCIDLPEKIIFLTYAMGVALVFAGSGYYHWHPDNGTLVWDRLPMTIAFMSLFSAVLADRISLRVGRNMFPVLVAVGISSVFYWQWTESMGQGDLRPYALVQFLPMLLCIGIFALFKGRYSHALYFWQMAGWYVLAKLLEHFDGDIYAMTGKMLSGHSVKHVAAALAAYAVVRWMRDRRLVGAV